VAALGRANDFDTSDKQAFAELENSIVDAGYAQMDWHAIQNFVGQTASNYSEIVRFICPRPEDVPGLMDGWMRMVSRIEGGRVDPVCAAAVTGFGFVFTHPFEDGNGRLHRFLIHRSLAKLEFAPQGVLFPVSAAMLRAPKAYDAASNAFSKNTMPLIKYEMDDRQRLTVLNSTDHLYRYYDATPQAEYLYEAVAETIRKDPRKRIEFLEVFDKATGAVKMIVDMPNARASLLARFILQNYGTLSAKKPRQFPQLRDEEITRIEEAIHRANAAADGEEETVSEFDEFLSSRESKQNQFRTAEEVIAQGSAAEWKHLKEETKALTAGKTVDGNPFQWAPYSASYPDFLQLKDVAAIFIDNGIRNGVPQACSIRLDRNASGPQGVFLEDKSPVVAEVWSLEPKAEGQNVAWHVKELGKNLTLAELPSQVAIRLVKQFETYEAAFGR